MGSTPTPSANFSRSFHVTACLLAVTQLEKIKVRSPVSTVAKLLDVYRRVDRVERITLKNNQDATRWMFKTIHSDYDPDTWVCHRPSAPQ